MASEFELIERHFAHLAPAGRGLVHGIGDDCAIVSPPAGMELAISIDTLVLGVHFPETTPAFDVGWKSLACGLSDIAAAGAEPAWALLALTLPEPDESWIAAFASGFGELAAMHGVALAGGDTTRGPMSVTVQVAGHVPAHTALGRGGARAGDTIYVSGWPGEAAAGLERVQRGGADPVDPLVVHLNRPRPRVALGGALRGLARACIDVSDGLAADAGHIADRSGVAAILDAAQLPVSDVLRAAGDVERVRAWILGGGDDYELCFCADPALHASVMALATDDVPVARIGEVGAGEGVWIRGADGRRVPATTAGYRHFTPDAG